MYISLKKRIVSVILVVVMMITMMPFVLIESFAGTEPTSYLNEPVVSGTANYGDNLEGDAKPVKYYYSDGYFKNSSNNYNKHLSTMSMVASMSTILNDRTMSETKAIFTSINYSGVETFRYEKFKDGYPELGNVSAVFAYKKLFAKTSEECIVIPVVVKGGYYGYEWINNFVVGDSGDAKGAFAAAENIKSNLENYITNNNLDKSKIKFWVMGYSRGGSVANVLGKLLSDDIYGIENVYGYSFEAQKCAYGNNDAASYSNLYCVCNANDYLTLLYPEYMGFNFYGNKIELVTDTDLSKNETVMKQMLATIHTGVDNYQSPKDFRTAKIKNELTNITNAGFIEIVTTLWNIYQNKETYEYITEDSTSKATQKEVGNLIVSRLKSRALQNRSAYTSNTNRTNNSNTTIDVQSVYVGGLNYNYTVEDAAKAVVNFIESTDQNTIDELGNYFESFPLGVLLGVDNVDDLDLTYILKIVFSGTASTNLKKIQSVVKFILNMELDTQWGNSSSTQTKRFQSLMTYLWDTINTQDSEYTSTKPTEKYNGIQGLIDRGLISKTQSDDLKAVLPIIIYTVAAYASNDVGQNVETIASAVNNWERIRQSHYPEINCAWLMSKDTFYTGETDEAYTVTFNTNGGSNIIRQTVESGSKATKPSDPTRTGYTFGGWYKEEACTNAFNFDTAINANTTVYAKWTGISYKIAFNKNNGSGTTMTAMNMVYGTAKALTANTYTRSGYTFAGWNTKADGSGDSYADKASVNNLITTPDATVTLYAQWTQEGSSGIDELFKDSPYPRLAGSTAYDTNFEAVSKYLLTTGNDKFETIIIACGRGFADGLSGGYLSRTTNATIYLTNTTTSSENNAYEYISNNIKSGGKVYILGGNLVVTSLFEEKLKKLGEQKNLTIKRLWGESQYETNTAVLSESDKYIDSSSIAAQELIVAAGINFPDALSASSTGRRVLLVPSKSLTSDELSYLRELKKEGLVKKVYVAGGTAVVKKEMAERICNELGLTWSEDNRLWGQTAYDTSYALARQFFPTSKTIVLAAGTDFPDGLSAGPLGNILDCPVLLIAPGKIQRAQNYVIENGVNRAVILGGSKVMRENDLKQIFPDYK